MTILLMGLGSFFIALLPSYQQVGVVATFMFVVLRIMQGMAMGGEIPSVVVFLKESLPKTGGLACGIIFCFMNFGVTLAEIMKLITTSFISDNYAWRVAFMSGGIAAIISYFFRKEIHETDTFLNKTKSFKLPIIQVFIAEKTAMLKAVATISILATVVAAFSLYLPAFLDLNKTQDSDVIILVNMIIFSLACIPAGYLADKFSSIIILLIGIGGLLIFGSIFYIMIVYGFSFLIPVMIINDIFMGMIVGVSANYASMLFSPEVRASGFGFSYNIGFAIFAGSFSPIASYGVINGSNLAPLYVAVTIISVLTLILFFPKNTTKNVSID